MGVAVGFLGMAWGAIVLARRRWFAEQLSELSPGSGGYWLTLTTICGVVIFLVGLRVASL